MTTNIKTTWTGENTFLAEDGEGRKTNLSGEHLRPMQMLLASLAGCSGVDVVLILEKKRVKLSDFQIEISAERAETYPKVYTDIHLTYSFWGENIKKKDVEQAIELSENKYCSVSAMLKSTAKITSEYKIFE